MFWRGVWGYLPLNVLQALVAFGVIVAFTRLLTPAEFGAYALAFSVVSLAQTMAFTWVEAAMARFWAQADERGERPAHFATLYALFAAVALLFAGLTAAVLLWPGAGELKTALAAGFGAAIARSLAIMARERRRAAGEVLSASGLDALATASGFGFGLAFAVLNWGAAAPLLGAGVGALLVAIVATPRELSFARGGRFEAARAADYARYGVPVSLSLLLSLVLATTDRFLLAHFTDEATVGVYHSGYSLANRTLDVMFVWLGMAGWPALVSAWERGGPDALRPAAREQARLMMLIALPAAVGLALVARPLAEVLVGEAFREGAARITPWIAASGLLGGFTIHYLHHAFTLARRTERFVLAMLVPVAANVALCLLLIPPYGAVGAAAATAMSFALGAAASWLLGRTLAPLPVPIGDLGRCLLACAAMTAAVLAVPAVGGLAELTLKGVVGAIVYAGTAWALDASGARSQSRGAWRAWRARTAAAA